MDEKTVGWVLLGFTPEAVELRQRVAEAVEQDAAMWLGPDRLRLLLGLPERHKGWGRFASGDSE